MARGMSRVFGFFASLMRTQLPRFPGTTPLTYTRFRFVSTANTRRFDDVRLSLPICPGIFVPFHLFPGLWHAPVEPALRWCFELPCDAFPPAKPCRFITPCVPFPLVTPCTSTCCPGTKCPAPISNPTGSMASSLTLNSNSFLFGGTPAASKCPLCRKCAFFLFWYPLPTCTARYPSVSGVSCLTTWHSSSHSTVSGTFTPFASHLCVMPTLSATAPVLALVGVHGKVCTVGTG
mmetsp:Transcript_10943/g.24613  ORF Transcript_10943/g.24613 Transcript_10943/m.24613 type:complete len:234 (-) Transcript_10943:21-722(-)